MFVSLFTECHFPSFNSVFSIRIELDSECINMKEKKIPQKLTEYQYP